MKKSLLRLLRASGKGVTKAAGASFRFVKKYPHELGIASTSAPIGYEVGKKKQRRKMFRGNQGIIWEDPDDPKNANALLRLK